MPWEAWVLVVSQALGALLAIALIGKPREPITPTLATAIVIVQAFYAWCVFRLI